MEGMREENICKSCDKGLKIQKIYRTSTIQHQKKQPIKNGQGTMLHVRYING
jgi:hypothetical protein